MPVPVLDQSHESEGMCGTKRLRAVILSTRARIPHNLCRVRVVFNSDHCYYYYYVHEYTWHEKRERHEVTNQFHVPDYLSYSISIRPRPTSEQRCAFSDPEPSRAEPSRLGNGSPPAPHVHTARSTKLQLKPPNPHIIIEPFLLPFHRHHRALFNLNNEGEICAFTWWLGSGMCRHVEVDVYYV